MLRENGRAKDVHMTGRGHTSKSKHYFATESHKTIELLNNFNNNKYRNL